MYWYLAAQSCKNGGHLPTRFMGLGRSKKRSAYLQQPAEDVIVDIFHSKMTMAKMSYDKGDYKNAARISLDVCI